MNTATHNTGGGGGASTLVSMEPHLEGPFTDLSSTRHSTGFMCTLYWSKGARPWVKFSGLPCKYGMDYWVQNLSHRTQLRTQWQSHTIMSKNVSKASGRGGGQQTWKQDKSEPPEAGDPTRSLKASHYLDKLMNLYSLPFFFLKKSLYHFHTRFKQKKKASRITHI